MAFTSRITIGLVAGRENKLRVTIIEKLIVF